MITISEIRISNLGPIEDYVYKFPSLSGTFAIRGKNGKGKSHLVGALQATATNTIFKDKPRGALVRHYGENGETAKIEVTYDVNGDPMTVCRTITPKRGADIAEKLAMGAYPDTTTKHAAYYRDQDCKKAGDVEELVAAVFGLSNEVQASSVFVLQNQAGALLNGTESERKAAFQFLSGSDILAQTNQYAAKRLQQFPVQDFSEDISLTQLEVDKITQDIATATAELENCPGRVDNAQVRALHDQLSALQNARRAAEKRERNEREVTNNLATAREIKKKIDAVMDKIDGLGIASAAPNATEQHITVCREVRRLQRDKEHAEVELKKLREGVPPKPVADLQKFLDGLVKARIELKHDRDTKHSNLKKFDKSGKCPTCGSGGTCPKCGHVLNEVQASITQWNADIDKADQDLKILGERIQKGEAAVAASKKYWALHDGAAADLSRAENGLEKLVEQGDIESLAAVPGLLADLKSYEDSQEAYKPLAEEEKRLRRQMDQTLATVKALRNNQEEVPDIDTSEEREKKLEKDIDDATNVAQTRGRLEGTVKSLEMSLEGAKKRLATLQEKQDAMAKTRRVAEYLQGIRSATHPGAIPKDRAVAYIERLNSYLGFYCRELKMPFNLVIDAEHQEMMVSIDDYLMPARHRLSDGQKTMAAWTWHLALYAMHGSKVGFIVMDEPTTGLDSDNRQRVADAIQNLNHFCTNAGLQMIMITHDMDLASVFSHIIEI